MSQGGKFAAAAIPAVNRTGELAHNWDGHYGDAPPDSARAAATQFLQRIEDKFGSLVPQPTIGAVGDGVMLLWRGRRRPDSEIAIFFYEDGNEWTIRDRSGKEKTRRGTNVDPEALFRVVDENVAA